MPDDSPSHLITPPYPRSLVEPFLGIDSFSSTRGGFSDLRGIWKFHKEKTRGLSPIAASTWSRSAGNPPVCGKQTVPRDVHPGSSSRCTTGDTHWGSVRASLAFRTWARMQRLGEEGHICLAAALFPLSTCRRKGRLNSVFYLAMRGRSSCRWRKNRGVRFGIVAHHFREYSFGFVVLLLHL
jgi:hypothetical protein